MVKTYQITLDKIPHMAVAKLSKKALGTLVAIFLFCLLANFAVKNGKDVPPEMLWYVLAGCAITLILMAAMLWCLYRLQILITSNYKITVTEELLQKHVDIEDEQQLYGLNKFLWTLVKRKAPLYTVSIKWLDIVAVAEKKYGLHIKAKNTTYSNGQGQIIVPKQIAGYEELKTQITIHSKKNVY